MQNIMIDTETLGTTADAIILSLGAVRFDLATGEIDDAGFYGSVSIESNLQYSRRLGEDTLLWWLKQTAAAQQVYHEPKQPLALVLDDFADWLGAGDNFMWSNGADFDLPLLAHAYTQIGREVPWQFWNSRCFRTYKNLPGAKLVSSPITGIKHNALSDALSQAQHLCAIHKALFRNSMVKA